jgi:hypothetical protein
VRIRFSPAFAHIQYVLPIFFLFLQKLLFLFPDFDTGLIQIQRLQLRGGGTKPVQRRRRRLDWQSPDRDRDYSSDERSSSDHGMSCDSEWIPETSSTSSMDNSSEGRILADYPRNVVSSRLPMHKHYGPSTDLCPNLRLSLNPYFFLLECEQKERIFVANIDTTFIMILERMK